MRKILVSIGILIALPLLGRTVPIGVSTETVSFPEIGPPVTVERPRYLIPRELYWRGWPLGDFGFYPDPLMGSWDHVTSTVASPKGLERVGAAIVSVNLGSETYREEVLALISGYGSFELPLSPTGPEVYTAGGVSMVIVGRDKISGDLVILTQGGFVFAAHDRPDLPHVKVLAPPKGVDTLAPAMSQGIANLIRERFQIDLTDDTRKSFCDPSKKLYARVWAELSGKECPNK